MSRSIQVHRLLYEAPLPLNSYGQLSGKYGRVTSYVWGGGYILLYILSIMLYFMFHCISPLAWELWLYGTPTVRSLSNFEFLFQ